MGAVRKLGKRIYYTLRDEVEGNIETGGKTKLTISRGSTH